MLYFKQIFMGALLLTAVCQPGQASHSDSDRDHYRHSRQSHHGYSHKHSDVFKKLEKELNRHDGFKKHHDRHDHSHHRKHHHYRHDDKTIIVPGGSDCGEDRNHHKVRETHERFEHRGVKNSLVSWGIFAIKTLPFVGSIYYLTKWGLEGASQGLGLCWSTFRSR